MIEVHEKGGGSEQLPLRSRVIISAAHRDERPASFLESFGDAVRKNPASAALISMGAVWLFLGGSRVSLFGERSRERRIVVDLEGVERRAGRDRHGARGSRASPSTAARSAAEAASEVGSRLQETAGDVGSALGDTASRAASRSSDAISAAYDSVESAAQRARDLVSDAASSAYETSRAGSRALFEEAEQLRRDVSDLFERQPLLLGGVGLALGAGIAAILPRTRTEKRVMGEASDAAKERVQELASDQLDKARVLADRALQELAREAKAQGLSDAALADAIRAFSEKLTRVASATGDALNSELDEAARRDPAGRPG